MVEGFNELDAVTRIKESCDIVLKVEEVNEEKKGLLNMEIGGEKLNDKAFTVMCSQFAIILRSGIPIARTVHLVANKTADKPLKKILTQVAEDVEAGRSVAASFEDRGSKLLPKTFIETLRAGEESGSIDKSFQTVYEQYDKQIKVKNKVSGALAYPMFVLALAVVVVIVLMAFVVPKFTETFESYGAQLPLITRILIAISTFFKNYWMILFIIIALIIVGVKIYGKTENGRMKMAKLQLKLPVLGNIAELTAASQFANCMTTMLSAGIPLTKSISITAKTLDNYYVSTEVGKLASKIEEGHGLGDSMREAEIMPEILTDMVAVGEETGEMENTLRTIAGYYDEELNQAIDSALKKLEPALLVGLAVVAGFIVIAIYMAMFSMYDIM
ncbi:MAG: type II secretion system F family protein [Oscillospiraceae bacterium]|nr:type II secretion system F family protein [Oscillospiraceae bacterium]